MKTTITPEDIINVLDSFDYSVNQFKSISDAHSTERFSIENWNKVMKTFLDRFWSGYDWVPPIGGRAIGANALIWMNERMKDKMVQPVTKISVPLLYPNSLAILHDKGELRFNIKEFGELYKILLEFQGDNYHNKLLDDRNRLFLKVLLNFTWGALNSRTQLRYIACENPDLIPLYLQKSLVPFIEKNAEGLIYVDTDTIWVYDHNLSEPLKELIRGMGLPVEEDRYNRFLLMNPKRYAEEEQNGNWTFHGIHQYVRREYTVK